MSYILDALKKAERERNLGQVPQVTQAEQSPLFQDAAAILPLQRAAGWLMGSLVLIILAAAGLGTLFSQQQQAATITRAHMPAITTPVAEHAPTAHASETVTAHTESLIPVTLNAETKPTVPRLAAELETATTESATKSVAPLAQQVAPLMLPKPAQKVMVTDNTKERAEKPTAPSVESVVTKPKSTNDENDKPVLSRVVKPTVAELPTVSPVITSPAPLKTQNIVLLQELPASVQQRVSPLVVSVHVYADQPSQRFVLINGQRYRENMNLPKGIRLLQIGPTDIVLQYQQWQFRLNPL